MLQKQALDILKLGYNVFLTGTAGSGKTYVLNAYIEYLKKRGVPVGITSSTGVAANHINGITIHSWAGIGVHNGITNEYIDNLYKRPYLRRRITHTKVLIIDEVSMLADHTLESIDKICRAFKNSNRPFGGIQVVLCGDFFQLPPVAREGEDINFIYHSKSWDALRLKVCYLEKVFRQDDDEFLTILNEIRNNTVSKESIKLLAARINKPIDHYSIPTRLYTHNANVDSINERELMKIKSPMRLYSMKERGIPYVIEMMKKNSLVPETLVLKIGAQVMFVKNNFEKGYVNGTLGRVVNFDEEDNPVVKTIHGDSVTVTPGDWIVEEEGNVLARIKQVPLRLAWAMSVHKSQGMNLDIAEIDLSRPFAPGMGYVALSRVRTLSGVRLLGLNHKALQVHEEVVEIDKFFRSESQKAVRELMQLEWIQKQNQQMEVLRAMRRPARVSHMLPSTVL